MKQIIEQILQERFGKDSLFSVATVENGLPFVRVVDGYYEDGYIYVLTYALSNKMRQIAKNPNVALAGEWFTTSGKGVNLGWFKDSKNTRIAEKMRTVFASWIDNGHNDFDDVNTCILQVKLEKGIVFANGARYEFDIKKDEENE
jgi:hypothetical protein